MDLQKVFTNKGAPKGNILVLIIFVLVVSSLMGLLARSFLKNFMIYNNQIFLHLKTNYLTKAGIELGLAMSNYREVGFQYEIGSGDAIIKDNFTQDEGIKYFLMTITSKAPVLVDNYRENGQQCENGYNTIVLKPGLGLVIPLFEDQGADTIFESLSNKGRQKTKGIDAVFSHGGDFPQLRSLIEIREHASFYSQEIIGYNPMTISNNGQLNTYYILVNMSTIPQEICLEGKNVENMLQEKILIESFGAFRNEFLGKRAIYTKAIPDFLRGDIYLGGL